MTMSTMSTMSTMAEFMSNKLRNLESFCTINLKDEKFTSFCMEVKHWQKADVLSFLCFFYSVVKPMGIEQYIQQLLQKHNLKKEDFTIEHYAMLQAYAECFVALAE